MLSRYLNLFTLPFSESWGAEMRRLRVKDAKVYRCPKCGWILHQIATPKKQRCVNPKCSVTVVRDPEPVKAKR